MFAGLRVAIIPVSRQPACVFRCIRCALIAADYSSFNLPFLELLFAAPGKKNKTAWLESLSGKLVN